jgi:hypothetical protein
MAALYDVGMSEQRWLSMQGICEVLQTSQKHIRWLAQQGYLEKLPSDKKKHPDRYLDPTPAYAERLRIAEAIYRRRVVLPRELDLSDKAIFSVQEVAAIMRWNLNTARTKLKRSKVPCIKCGSGKTAPRLYTASTVRDLLMQRAGFRTKHRAPILLTELVQWFRENHSQLERPSDRDFAADTRFKKRLEVLLRMPSPQRERAFSELWSKVEMAKSAARIGACEPSSD